MTDATDILAMSNDELAAVAAVIDAAVAWRHAPDDEAIGADNELEAAVDALLAAPATPPVNVAAEIAAMGNSGWISVQREAAVPAEPEAAEPTLDGIELCWAATRPGYVCIAPTPCEEHGTELGGGGFTYNQEAVLTELFGPQRAERVDQGEGPT